MKAFKVLYRSGHFIDKETNKRIIPSEGKEYIITGDMNSFKSEDEKLEIESALPAEKKMAWAQEKFGDGNFKKILSAGEQLFFRVGNSKIIQEDKSNQYIFLCCLVEDLYIYLSKGKTGTSDEDWRLVLCQCTLEKCLLGDLTLSEKIRASSLNRLFSQTVMFYFNMQRSGSANAFNTFYKYTPGMEVYFDMAKHSNKMVLGNLRRQITNEFRKGLK